MTYTKPHTVTIPTTNRINDLVAGTAALALLGGVTTLAAGPAIAMAGLAVTGCLFGLTNYPPRWAPDKYPALNTYILDQLTKRVGIAPMQYGVSDSDFASEHLTSVSNSRVFMSQRLIDEMPQEKQTAILAHEVGHSLYQRTPSHFIKAASLATAGIAAYTVASAALGNGTSDTAILSCFNALTLRSLYLWHHRQEDRACDRVAVQLTGTADLADALEANSRQPDLKPQQRYSLSAIFSKLLIASHDPLPERIANIRQMAAQMPEADRLAAQQKIADDTALAQKAYDAAPKMSPAYFAEAARIYVRKTAPSNA